AREDVLQWNAELKNYRDRLAKIAVQCIEDLNAEQRFRKLEEIVTAADSDVKEIITLLEDLPLDEAVRTIELAHEDMVEVHSACKKLASTRNWSAEQRHQGAQLIRRARRLQDLTGKFRVEKRLKQRMTGLFGQPFVSFLDRLVLVLIFAIIGLFVEELIFMFMDPSPLALHDFDYFAWVDLAICSVLMGEFFLKFALADRKW